MCSCAKFSYIVEQGVGQVSLEVAGRKNETVLNDQTVSDAHKLKIKKIMKAKKFFYNYFELKPTNIYDQTTFLEQDAVTYLVIHSAKNRIHAEKTSFPFVGEFPYLGFFSQSSAINYKKELEAKGFATYMRPVYAYSTLNHPLLPFDDNILSSFFHFSDEELINLIFHELTHTIIFVKDEAEFNENLASFIADELSDIYFKKKFKLEKKDKLDRALKLNKELMVLIKELEARYKKTKKYDLTLNKFLEETFYPRLKAKCLELKIEKCQIAQGEWNNARFAAFKTYENKRNEIEDIYEKTQMDLKSFLRKLMKIYNEDNYKTPFVKNFE